MTNAVVINQSRFFFMIVSEIYFLLFSSSCFAWKLFPLTFLSTSSSFFCCINLLSRKIPFAVLATLKKNRHNSWVLVFFLSYCHNFRKFSHCFSLQLFRKMSIAFISHCTMYVKWNICVGLVKNQFCFQIPFLFRLTTPLYFLNVVPKQILADANTCV